MSNVDSTKQVWKFSYEAWNGNLLQGAFVASQEQIDWIIGLAINFGDLANKGLDVVARMDSDYFEIVNEDAAFAEQFATTVGTTGTSPFDMLDDKQFIAHELEFGEVRVNGKVVKVTKPEAPLEEFVDEGTRVVTYDITDDIMIDDTANSRQQEAMDKFLSQFEIVKPQGYMIHLSPRVEMYTNGDLDCMKVIKRKSDGALFGYRYIETRGETYVDFNGGLYDLGSKYRPAYVWFPVKPFTITGYELSEA